MAFTDMYDKVYLKQVRRDNPKEYFKFINSKCHSHLSLYSSPRILDIGCATGDFLWFMRRLYPNAVMSGFDVTPEYIARAQDDMPDCHFFIADIHTGADLPEGKYDALFMNGVNSIFDDYEPWIENSLKLLNDGGRAYIFGLFNPNDVDVIIKERKAGQTGPWLSGINLFSKKTISQYLDKIQTKHIFYDFQIDIDIDKTPDEPMRSWTIKDERGVRMIVSGAQVIYPFSLLELWV